ncbi:hypothetical protein [Sphingomonas koreensis]
MIALAAGHAHQLDGLSSATAIFGALGRPDFQERESSNYVEGRYFEVHVGQFTLTVSYGDSDEMDLPIWLLLDGPDERIDAFAMKAADALSQAGFLVARLENFGRHDEMRVDL